MEVRQQITYVAYGQKAINEVSLSIKTLRKHNEYPITVICKERLSIPDVNYVEFDDNSFGARFAKLSMDTLVNNDVIGYIDADTRVHGSLEPAFKIIEMGWDMALSYSTNQGGDVLKHINERERETTLGDNPFPLQLQCGVMFFNRHTCKLFFGRWRHEWQKYGNKDQAAFIRALEKQPIKIALLGRPWNGGNIVEHLFGRAHNY